MIQHDWDISPREAIALQRKLALQVRVEPLDRPVRLVGGTDCAFIGNHRGGLTLAVAVLYDAATFAVAAEAFEVLPCRFPYVPGLLTFREAPAVIAAINKLPSRPDLLMCDGQGIAHPRRIGLATHLGLLLDLPTIGAAKSRLCGLHRQPGPARGRYARLVHDGEVVGVALRTRDAVKPLYVSIGHRITLNEAIAQVLGACRGFRLPEPTRQAHHRVTLLKAKLLAGESI